MDEKVLDFVVAEKFWREADFYKISKIAGVRTVFGLARHKLWTGPAVKSRKLEHEVSEWFMIAINLIALF